jgi:Family of unknown function (DUF6492)
MSDFILFCKSFRDDVLRVKRLLDSVIEFNEDQIPFYLCVPERDLNLFHELIDFDKLKSTYQGIIDIITDESVVRAMGPDQIDIYHQTKGYISQQVIKAQVWKKIPCDSYLSLDSDSFFTKNFKLRNFLNTDGTPFTLMHDCRELLDLSEQLGYTEVKKNFLTDSFLVKQEFGRIGEDFDFGPAPLIWSRTVWASLDQHLENKSETIWEAFTRIPSEIRWYGETLLKYKSIPIHPTKPIFSCYHYEWQATYFEKNPQYIVETDHFIGEVRQSYWDHTLTPSFARKSLASRIWRKIKTKLQS